MSNSLQNLKDEVINQNPQLLENLINGRIGTINGQIASYQEELNELNACMTELHSVPADPNAAPLA